MHRGWLLATVFLSFLPSAEIIDNTKYRQGSLFACKAKKQNKKKLREDDRNSQASCAFATLFLPSQWCSQSSPFQSFSCFYSKISRGFNQHSYYGIYCRKRCHLAFLLLSLYICLTGYTDKCFLQLYPVPLDSVLQIDGYYADITENPAKT